MCNTYKLKHKALLTEGKEDREKGELCGIHELELSVLNGSIN